MVTLDYLDEDDVVRILTEPKNAFVKQYQKFFALDDVELAFHEGALRAIAKRALARGTGARGLKSIIEDVLLNSMFEVPSRPDIKRCVITEQSIQDGVEPAAADRGAAPHGRRGRRGGRRRQDRLRAVSRPTGRR